MQKKVRKREELKETKGQIENKWQGDGFKCMAAAITVNINLGECYMGL